MATFERLNFYFEFFEKGLVFPQYKSIYNNTNGQQVHRNEASVKRSKNKVLKIGCIPPYFEVKLGNDSDFQEYSIPSRTGYLTNLEGYDNVDDYMKGNLKRQRKQIVRKIKRLELCFDVSYKTFYGKMEKEEYDRLFGRLLRMIEKRFSQNGRQHAGLKKWTAYQENVYDMILKKRAVLFVIYIQEKPVAISFGYTCQNILVSTICSFDTDYAKFGLGQIDTVKNIEWCFNNGYTHYDMMWGDLTYKREWSNMTLNYRDQILFPKNNYGKRIKAYTIAKVYVSWKYLKSTKPFVFIKSLNSVLNYKPKSVSNAPGFLLPKVVIIDSMEVKEKLSKVDIEQSTKYAFLRLPIYNFQYLNSENSDSIDVYKSEDNTFFVVGKSNKIKLEYIGAPAMIN